MARPPGAFVAGSVEFVVMAVAQRHGELVRDFEAHGARLCKAEMVGVRGPAPADETRLAGDEGEMRLIAQPLVFGIGER